MKQMNDMEKQRIIEIERLSKSFGSVRAVQDCSFHVNKGELFAFLGINGAGKSTTISMMCGQLKKDSGTVRVCGMDADSSLEAISQKIGVVFQNSYLDLPLTVRDNLKSRAALYGITGKAFETRLCELAGLLNFSDLLSRPLGKLSGGQRRRIDVARALFHNPEILILDEPTTGLDPQTRRLLWGVVNGLRKRDGLTVFLTTHYMEEAADADYITVIDSGRIVAQGTPLELKNQYVGDYITLYGIDEVTVKGLGVAYEPIRDAYRITVPDTARATELIVSHPDVFRDYEVIKGRMDDVFLAVTGKALPDNAEEAGK